MTTIFDKLCEDDAEYMNNMLNELTKTPAALIVHETTSQQNKEDIDSTSPLAYLPISIMENLRLGGPWHTELGLSENDIKNEEVVEQLWTTVQAAYVAQSLPVPVQVAVRLTNPIYNPQSLIDYIVNTDISLLNPRLRFDLVLETSICCLDIPEIVDWVGTSVTAIALDGICENNAVDNNKEKEAWEIVSETATQIIDTDPAYAMLMRIMDMNNTTLPSDDDDKEVEKPIDYTVTSMDTEEIEVYITSTIESLQDVIKTMPDFLQVGMIISELSEDVQNSIDADELYDTVERLLNA